ncbi:hypothetical protein, partial [Rhizobium sp. Root1220]|uniref:hypothetical protein n=1 Tax=Rhizobium sp. Root1220 TaxID=1736432 RepID=UPI001AEC7C0E
KALRYLGGRFVSRTLISKGTDEILTTNSFSTVSARSDHIGRQLLDARSIQNSLFHCFNAGHLVATCSVSVAEDIASSIFRSISFACSKVSWRRRLTIFHLVTILLSEAWQGGGTKCPLAAEPSPI